MKPNALIKDDFNDLPEYQRWLKEAMQNLKPSNRYHRVGFSKEVVERQMKDPDWFGDNTSYELLDAGVTEYQNPELLDELYQQVNHEISPDVAQKLKARKLRFNALGFGMFSFDRASMTIYRNPEFYSPLLHTKVDSREVIETEKGFLLKSDNSEIQKRWEQKADGSPKIRTHTKKLFAYFPEVPRERHAVEFFISCDGPGSLTAGEMLYGGVSAVIMAELLIKAGIKVKINVVIGSATSNTRSEYVGCIIPVKNYDETLDRNIVALLSSDPRFMRYDGFKGVVAAFDNFSMMAPPGMGYAMNAAQLKTLLETSGYTQKSKAAHRYYFGGTTDTASALRDIEHTIYDIANKLNA